MGTSFHPDVDKSSFAMMLADGVLIMSLILSQIVFSNSLPMVVKNGGF